LGSQDYLFINEAASEMIDVMMLVAGDATTVVTISSHQGSHGAGLASFVAVPAPSSANQAAIHSILLSILALLLVLIL